MPPQAVYFRQTDRYLYVGIVELTELWNCGMAEWLAKWRNGVMAEWWNGGMAEWHAKWQDGGMA